ncbi:major intrinsic protein, Aquaporin-like protein [Artemisia annua]|uniref:Major intrinsic protein, Aquaporin-like protein n=1 Tax=Artemisia annua TaxID=35608 RepID=A0A2U1LIQ1_ARTAN|nr:major intrinsic protein, Aquaporin-like protein [Artemisia annua]
MLDDVFSYKLVVFVTSSWGSCGVLALTELMPLEYKHMLEGPTLKVDLHTRAIAEGVLTFLTTIVVLIIIIRGPKSFFMKNWMLSVATMAVIIPGSTYTGPSMNPANKKSAIVTKKTTSKELRWYISFHELVVARKKSYRKGSNAANTNHPQYTNPNNL